MRWLVAILLASALTTTGGGRAAWAADTPASGAAAAVRHAAEVGVRWNELSAGRQAALRPLERDWSQLNDPNKQKWIQLADRMPSMSAADRERIIARMSEWARMTPHQRSQARLRFQEASRVAPTDRQKRWHDYQALPPEKRSQLAARTQASAPAGTVRIKPRDDTAKKSNIVSPPSQTTPRAVAPAVMQAQPGATTSLMSRKPSPPAHQKPGQPKIAATPGFVDSATLLPKRTAQRPPARPASAATAGSAAR